MIRRHLALYVLSVGVLMIVLDTTVVTVALPTIQAQLGFSATALTWVLNAYLLTYGGCLLLGGRLGDLYGARRLFLAGLAIFTFASLGCGLAHTRLELIAARAVQGVGGAVVTAVSLSLIMQLFTEPGERAAALGIYGFIAAAGGGLGELLGGVLTQGFGWPAVFLINLPIGAGVYVLSAALVPRGEAARRARSLDVAGAVVITTALMIAVYGIVGANAAGWASARTVGLLGCAVLLLAAFPLIEQRVREPLMPLKLFKLRNLVTANAVGALWAAGIFVWFVTCALYLQHVLDYDPLRIGLAFLPADVLTAVLSAGVSARIVMRFGIRAPMVCGLALTVAGLALFACARLDGAFVWDVLPGMVLLGVGSGIGFNPVFLAATNDVDPDESGLASGVVNTSFMMGGALGLAALTSLADARTRALLAAGTPLRAALNDGYHLAFWLAAASTAGAAVLTMLVLRPRIAAPETTPVSA
ncbi:MAG: MFS transporter [Steroidobacteraceae bacterium]